jgi:hypothetical protein
MMGGLKSNGHEEEKQHDPIGYMDGGILEKTWLGATNWRETKGNQTELKGPLEDCLIISYSFTIFRPLKTETLFTLHSFFLPSSSKQRFKPKFSVSF